MNREFTGQLLEHIKKVPAHQVEMNVWLEKNFPNKPTIDRFRRPWITEIVENPEDYICGTTGCCAGHAVLVDIEQTKLAIKEIRSYEIVNFSSVAGHLLGIDYDTRKYLFDRDLWPNEYCEDGDKNGLIAILERALEDNSFDFIFD